MTVAVNAVLCAMLGLSFTGIVTLQEGAPIYALSLAIILASVWLKLRIPIRNVMNK